MGSTATGVDSGPRRQAMGGDRAARLWSGRRAVLHPGASRAARRQHGVSPPSLRPRGLWDNSVGRKKGTLLGQEVREWMCGAREAGLRALYAVAGRPPLIQRDRLNKRYFRRWFYWNGVSRALLYRRCLDRHASARRTDVDFSRVPHILASLASSIAKRRANLAACWRVSSAGTASGRFDAEFWLWFFAGVVKQRWQDRAAERPPVYHARVGRGRDELGRNHSAADGSRAGSGPSSTRKLPWLTDPPRHLVHF